MIRYPVQTTPLLFGGDQSPLNDSDDMEPEMEPELEPLEEEQGIDEPQ